MPREQPIPLSASAVFFPNAEPVTTHGGSMGIRTAIWISILSLLFVPLAGGSSPAERKPFQMKDVFGLVYASDPQISPDGQRIVYARTFMDIMKDCRRSNATCPRNPYSHRRTGCSRPPGGCQKQRKPSFHRTLRRRYELQKYSRGAPGNAC